MGAAMADATKARNASVNFILLSVRVDGESRWMWWTDCVMLSLEFELYGLLTAVYIPQAALSPAPVFFCLRSKMTMVHCHELERYITSLSLV